MEPMTFQHLTHPITIRFFCLLLLTVSSHFADILPYCAFCMLSSLGRHIFSLLRISRNFLHSHLSMHALHNDPQSLRSIQESPHRSTDSASSSDSLTKPSFRRLQPTCHSSLLPSSPPCNSDRREHAKTEMLTANIQRPVRGVKK